MGLVDAQDLLALVCICIVQYIMVCPMLHDCHQTMHCTIKLLLPRIGFVPALVICGMTAQCYLCAIKHYIEQSIKLPLSIIACIALVLCAFCCSVQWVQAMLVIRYFDEITIFEDRNGLSANQICKESFYLQWYVASHGNMLSNLQASDHKISIFELRKGLSTNQICSENFDLHAMCKPLLCLHGMDGTCLDMIV